MPELHLQRTDDILTIRLGEQSASVPWTNIAPDATTGQRIYDDAIAYGKELFEKTFPAGPLRTALTTLRANERLVLVIDDPLVAAIPWEYLRDAEGRLLAARLNLVRSVSGAQQNAELDFTLPLQVIAVPVSPVDDPRVLDTEGEWQRVVGAVSKQGKALTLTRVRPPTLDLLERALNSERTTLVHFMGHSDSRDGKGFLVFEEAHGCSYLIEAADFADSLVATNIFLVVLNSCRSAVAWDWTAFGNIARGLVREGVPYALGMQFVLPDDVALAMSQALYDFLLQGRGVEEAVRRTRRALEHNTNLRNAPWLAGIPVLYTSLREQPAAPLSLWMGNPASSLTRSVCRKRVISLRSRRRRISWAAAKISVRSWMSCSPLVPPTLWCCTGWVASARLPWHGPPPSALAGITMTVCSPSLSRPSLASMPTTSASSMRPLPTASTTAWPASTSLIPRSIPRP